MKVMIGMSRRRQISNSLRVRSSIPLAASITMTAEIDGGQGAVGVLGKVLVARGVEQVEDAAAALEGHDRGDDGNAALPLDAHPVGAGAAALALGAHVAGELDGAAGAQQVLRQRGFAGVGVGDDREGAAAGDFGWRGRTWGLTRKRRGRDRPALVQEIEGGWGNYQGDGGWDEGSCFLSICCG